MKEKIYHILKQSTLSGLLLISLLCGIVLLYVKYYTTLSPIPDISGSERSTTIPIALVASGISLFTNPEISPFFITQYAPLYLEIIGQCYRLLGFDPTDAYKVQLASRIGSAIFVFSAMIVNYLTLTKLLKIHWQMAIITCIFLFGLLQHWHLTNSRVDSLLFLCTSLYLYFITRGLLQNNSWNASYFWAIFASIMAIFTKQSALIHCIILLGFFVLNHNWKAIGITVVVYITTSLVLIGLFNRFDFVSFFTHFFGSLNSPVMFDWFYDYTYTKLVPLALPLIVAAFLISAKWSQMPIQSLRFFLAIAMVGFFVFALGTSFKYGAGVGYFHEFVLTSTLASVYFFSEREFSFSPLTKWKLPAMLVAYTFYFTTSQVDKYRNTTFYEYAVELTKQQQVKEYMVQLLQKEDKLLVISGEQQAGNLLEQMLLHHIVAYQDDVIHFNNKNKSFDYSNLYEMAQNDGLKFIITKKPESDFYFNAIDLVLDKSKYVLIHEIEGYYIFQTKNSTNL